MTKSRRTFTRKAAASYLAEQLGVPYSPRTLEVQPVPYKVINGWANYDQPDLDAHIARLRSQAVRRTGRIRSATAAALPADELIATDAG